MLRLYIEMFQYNTGVNEHILYFKQFYKYSKISTSTSRYLINIDEYVKRD